MKTENKDSGNVIRMDADETRYAELVTLRGDRSVTTSLIIADVFGKKHKNVLRDIEALEIPESLHGLNFEPMSVEVKIGNGAVRKDPAYRITRDGFTLLVMGFTGRKAMAWKIRYIEAFNRMEAELRWRARNSGAAQRYFAVRTHNMVRDLKTCVEGLEQPTLYWFSPEIRFLGQCCVAGPNASELKPNLYPAYTRFCEMGRFPIAPEALFFKKIFAAMPFLKTFRTTDCDGIPRTGIRGITLKR
ncbi:hypothetical protein DENIS_3495 [Desulfonema ishimotonii]|uniref:Uncharacterized protein n=1 Tax=Desulfonema ishimotonii TaxID=45657 RepID=A0A401G012_9BACT|nr:Rha family transcriptional regulator [Desulfonema ishimotonii]GBC62523.1 hypothetical protein DENIS_3495 [Desulfonema ishimotonii]